MSKVETIDEAMNTKFPNDKYRLFANIVHTAHWLKSDFENRIKPFGLSSPQFNVLRILRGADDWLNMNEMKNRMVEKSPNTTRLCDKLVDKKLIERNRSQEDRRVVYLKVSQEGLDLLKEIDEHLGSEGPPFINNFTEAQAKAANEIIDLIRN